MILTIGLSYTISKDFGNCSIDYLENDATGDVHISDGGHLHMSNPFLDITKEGKTVWPKNKTYLNQMD